MLVARPVGIISTARRVISAGGGGTEGGSPNGSANRHSGAYTTIIAAAINAAPVSAPAIYATVINANASSIICGGVS